MRAMALKIAALAMVVVLALAATACPRPRGAAGAASEPVAEPVPAELEWPDAAIATSAADAGSSR